jgi:hypothetical protein
MKRDDYIIKTAKEILISNPAGLDIKEICWIMERKNRNFPISPKRAGWLISTNLEVEKIMITNPTTITFYRLKEN